MKNPYEIPCNIAQTLNIIGDKWTLLILRQIMKGKYTFKEILDGLDKIPTNLLSNRLKSLEADGIVVTKLYSKHPPRYEYNLTESGMDLVDVFNSLIIWGEKHLEKCYKQLNHIECGNKIIHSYYCPTCDMEVKREQIEVSEPNKNN
ncbi:MAG TPA: helix-turn-helix transcriptional regulator [Clostridiales bacterium]|nr:helix-turn-helix transcriptional regulator [Clostridiales bacterium]